MYRLVRGGCRAAIAAILTGVICVSAGCGTRTETPIVKYKEQDSEAKLIEAGQYENIRVQVQAPKRYQAAMEDRKGLMQVNADALVEVPEVQGIKLKRIQNRPFTQEDYEAVRSGLMSGADIWKWTERNMAAVEDITNMIWNYEEELDQLNKKNDAYSGDAAAGGTVTENAGADGSDADMWDSILGIQKELAYYYEQYEVFLKTMGGRKDDITIRYDEKAAEAYGREMIYGYGIDEKEIPGAQNVYGSFEEQGGEADSAAGEAAVDGAGYDTEASDVETNFSFGGFVKDGFFYSLEVNNNLSRYLKGNQIQILRIGAYGNLINQKIGREIEESQAVAAGLSVEEARQKADEAMQKMGLTDMKLCRTEEGVTYQLPSGYGTYDRKPMRSYTFTYFRTTDEVPVTFTGQTGNYHTYMDDKEQIYVEAPYEIVYLSYDELGLVSFNWEAPCKTESASEEYVFLLPFSEIQNIFESTVMNKYAGYAGQDIPSEMSIEKVTLGYMQVWDDEKGEESSLVPVWDFFGHFKVKEGDGMSYDLLDENASILTINAMDGTVIDRGAGH